MNLSEDRTPKPWTSYKHRSTDKSDSSNRRWLRFYTFYGPTVCGRILREMTERQDTLTNVITKPKAH